MRVRVRVRVCVCVCVCVCGVHLPYVDSSHAYHLRCYADASGCMLCGDAVIDTVDLPFELT